MRVKPLVILFICATVFAQAPSTPSSNPWIATWKLNMLASHYHDDAPQHETLRVTFAGHDGLSFQRYGTDGAGKLYNVSYRGTGDGRESDLMDGEKRIGTASYKIIDDKTIAGKGETLDRTVWTARTIISNDQKTLTSTFHFKTVRQEEYDVIKVYEK